MAAFVGSVPYRPWDVPIQPIAAQVAIRSVFLLLMYEKPLIPSSTPLLSLGLTAKEAEVLLWVSEGKTNEEISIILASTVGTVRKHLEHIHQKLGVENRSSAAGLARKVLV